MISTQEYLAAQNTIAELRKEIALLKVSLGSAVINSPVEEDLEYQDVSE